MSLYSDTLFSQEGIPVTSSLQLKGRPIRKHNNVQQWESLGALNYSVGIDRVLDHHLLLYIEYQTLESPEFGGEVGRGRQLFLIPKGETLVGSYYSPPDDSYPTFDRISVRVLPYTDMSAIELPVEVDNFDSSDDGFSRKDLVVVEGHTFRPYRIASSSFFMAQIIPTESDW